MFSEIINRRKHVIEERIICCPEGVCKNYKTNILKTFTSNYIIQYCCCIFENIITFSNMRDFANKK